MRGMNFPALQRKILLKHSVKKNTPGKTWWENEYWTKQEEEDLFKLLESDNTFDYVISHTGSHHINTRIFEIQTGYSKKFYD